MNSFEYFLRVAIFCTSVKSIVLNQSVHVYWTTPIWHRRPKLGLIYHPNPGSQYASKVFRRRLKAQGIQGSMSRKGDCWD
ncbi:MAG: hypothetical protein KZQ61_09525, partial [Candidatus Thiodiazotropha sp. (ex Lucinoma aequizonata)]|nr:hypothetical protein [Candidatus Thiodiazotropha sp. (ex Lucinoma aequizonata)]